MLWNMEQILGELRTVSHLFPFDEILYTGLCGFWWGASGLSRAIATMLLGVESDSDEVAPKATKTSVLLGDFVAMRALGTPVAVDSARRIDPLSGFMGDYPPSTSTNITERIPIATMCHERAKLRRSTRVSR